MAEVLLPDPVDEKRWADRWTLYEHGAAYCKLHGEDFYNPPGCPYCVREALSSLESQLALAREALEFYAKQSWMDDGNPAPARDCLAQLDASGRPPGIGDSE